MTTELDDSNFTPEQKKRWKALETAENKKKQEQSRQRQNSDGSGNDEQKFAPYFADANRQIDELESEANEKKSKIDSDLLKSKIEIVKDLAKKIEKEGFPIGGIANEIVHQLKGRISPTHIRDNLDDKYKDRRQSNNAKKRNVAMVVLPLLPKQQPSDATAVSREQEQDLATPSSETIVPAERNQQIMVGVDGHETTYTGSGRLPSEHEQGITTTKIMSPEDSESQPQQQQDLKVLIDWDELSGKMAKLRYKNIKNFWLYGRIENDKLLDIVLSR